MDPSAKSVVDPTRCVRLRIRPAAAPQPRINDEGFGADNGRGSASLRYLPERVTLCLNHIILAEEEEKIYRMSRK